MATEKTKFKIFEITKEHSQCIKGGYADSGIGGGMGANGFIIWDNLDPRDDNFTLSASFSSSQLFKVKKQK